MTRRLLDLFCGAGGAAMGYHRSGFAVVGVDINPQPNYPFEFYQGDALEYVQRHGREFDAIHASPPCQAYTTMSNRHRGTGGKADAHPRLINDTFLRLGAIGSPWVIENVPGALREMRDPIRLTGDMFSLGVWRPRLFDSNVPLEPYHRRLGVVRRPRIGVYGRTPDGGRIWTRKDGTIYRRAASLTEAETAMGIDWMTWPEITQAIPPAYTEWIGTQLMDYLTAEAAS